jgi:hypothetical protein
MPSKLETALREVHKLNQEYQFEEKSDEAMAKLNELYTLIQELEADDKDCEINRIQEEIQLEYVLQKSLKQY